MNSGKVIENEFMEVRSHTWKSLAIKIELHIFPPSAQRCCWSDACQDMCSMVQASAVMPNRERQAVTGGAVQSPKHHQLLYSTFNPLRSTHTRNASHTTICSLEARPPNLKHGCTPHCRRAQTPLLITVSPQRRLARRPLRRTRWLAIRRQARREIPRRGLGEDLVLGLLRHHGPRCHRIRLQARHKVCCRMRSGTTRSAGSRLLTMNSTAFKHGLLRRPGGGSKQRAFCRTPALSRATPTPRQPSRRRETEERWTREDVPGSDQGYGTALMQPVCT